MRSGWRGEERRRKIKEVSRSGGILGLYAETERRGDEKKV